MADRALSPPDWPDLAAALARDNPAELQVLVISVALDGEDFPRAEGLCQRLAQHPAATVRGNALLGFGHLARRFRRLSPASLAHLRTARRDASEYVRKQAAAAWDDVATFLG